jgi:hypothetical protein
MTSGRKQNGPKRKEISRQLQTAHVEDHRDLYRSPSTTGWTYGWDRRQKLHIKFWWRNFSENGQRRQRKKLEVDGTDSESRQMVGFGINSIAPSGSATTVLV